MPKITIVGASESYHLADGACLLSLQEQQDHLPFGCCAASCGTCAIAVLNGKRNLSEKTEAETQILDQIGEDGPDRRLACQCTVIGDITIMPL